MRSVALLRGVNVGGARTVAMPELAKVFETAGFDAVQTYIQSGNVVFSHPRRGGAALEAALEAAIENAFGFDVDVVVRSAKEMDAVVHANPFPSDVHVAFLKRAGTVAADTGAYEPEAYVQNGREVYLYLPDGIGRSKLPNVLNPLRMPVTVRNWNTVTTLAAMAG